MFLTASLWSAPSLLNAGSFSPHSETSLRPTFPGRTCMVQMREAMATVMGACFPAWARVLQGVNKLWNVPQSPELLPVTKS